MRKDSTIALQLVCASNQHPIFFANHESENLEYPCVDPYNHLTTSEILANAGTRGVLDVICNPVAGSLLLAF